MRSNLSNNCWHLPFNYLWRTWNSSAAYMKFSEIFVPSSFVQITQQFCNQMGWKSLIAIVLGFFGSITMKEGLILSSRRMLQWNASRNAKTATTRNPALMVIKHNKNLGQIRSFLVHWSIQAILSCQNVRWILSVEYAFPMPLSPKLMQYLTLTSTEFYWWWKNR